MKRYAIILAGGTGSRAAKGMPKQFVQLLGIPMLWWSVVTFHNENPATELIIVKNEGWDEEWEKFEMLKPDVLKEATIYYTFGGASRGDSVRAALKLIPESDGKALIAVHDGARPLVQKNLITSAWKEAEEYGSAVPAIPVTDSLRIKRGAESKVLDRANIVAIQTPQVFRVATLKETYLLDNRPEFTDDASRVEALGHKINLIPGDPENLKVTHPIDFKIAETLLQELNYEL